MGGAAGHMFHLYEDHTLKFSTLKDIIKQSLNGSLDIVEKTDGQNLLITWRDGQVKGARNKSTIIEPLSITEMTQKFSGRGELKNAFVNTMKDLQSAISTLSKPEVFFGDGFKFISLEIIYPPSKNVIDYGGRAVIQFHDITTFSEDGIKGDVDAASAQKLFKLLSKNNALKQDVFEIVGSQKLKPSDLSKRIPVYLKRCQKIQGTFSDKSTLGDYYDAHWSNFIRKRLPKIDTKTLNVLVQRYARHNIIVNKSKYKKKQPDVYDAMNILDKQHTIIYNDLKQPLETLIMAVGAEVLIHATGFMSANPSNTIKVLKKDFEAVIKAVERGELSEELRVKVAHSLEQLNTVGIENIAPTEGLVFVYRGKTYKMTGLFGRLNTIIGVFKYGR